MGLPKFSPKVCDQIIAYVEAGNFIRVAAAASGIDYSTLKKWQTRGLSDEPKDKAYKAFRTRLTQARATAETTAVQAVRTAALDPQHYRAACWYLERGPARERWKPPLNQAQVTTNSPSPADALKEAEQRADDYRPPEADPEADE